MNGRKQGNPRGLSCFNDAMRSDDEIQLVMCANNVLQWCEISSFAVQGVVRARNTGAAGVSTARSEIIQ